MCSVFFITNVLSHFFYLNQKVSLICKDFSWFSVCKTVFFYMWVSFHLNWHVVCTHTQRIEQNSAVQEETRCARMNRHSHRPVTCSTGNKTLPWNLHSETVHNCMKRSIFFLKHFSFISIFKFFILYTFLKTHDTSSNWKRIWYTCVIYLKVTKVCGET